MQAELSTSRTNSLVTAGADVSVNFTLEDCFGNVSADLAGRTLDVQATGPGLVTFTETSPHVFRLAHLPRLSSCTKQ